jgi:hypothetical protein
VANICIGAAGDSTKQDEKQDDIPSFMPWPVNRLRAKKISGLARQSHAIEMVSGAERRH